MIQLTKHQTLLHRLWKVVRINTVRPWEALGLPLVIMATLLAVTAVLRYLSIAFVSVEAQFWFAPEAFIIIYLFIVANQTTYHDFPISLSYGISRRDFYLGSLLTFGLLAVWYAVISTAIAAIAGTISLLEVSVIGYLDFLSLVVVFMGTQVLSASITTIYLRWGKPGMLTFFGLLALTLISLPVISRSGVADDLPRINSETIALVQSMAILNGITLAVALLGYLFIRRARVV
jgi:hypothetical protein